MAATSAIFKGQYTKLLTKLGLGLEAGQKVKYTDGAAAGSVPVSDAQGILSLNTLSGGGVKTGLTPASVPFIGPAGELAQDNTKLFWDNTNKRLGVGTNAPTANLVSASTTAGFYSTALLQQTNNGQEPARLNLTKTRGTLAAPTTVATNDIIGDVSFAAHDGTVARQTALIRSTATGTIGSNRTPSNLTFWTSTNASPSVVTERMRITSSGNVGIATTSDPGSPLEVAGDIRCTINTNRGFYMRYNALDFGEIGAYDWTGSSYKNLVIGSANIGVQLNSTPSMPLSFSDTPGDKILLHGVGGGVSRYSIGIGTDALALTTGAAANAKVSILYAPAVGQAYTGTPGINLYSKGTVESLLTTPTAIGQRVVAAAAQTADLANWCDSSSNVLASVCALGCGTFTGMQLGIRTVVAAPTITKADHTILCDCTGGAITATLPAAATNSGRILVFKKIDASVNALTLDGNASETIDGALTKTTLVQWDTIRVQCNGTAWFVI